MNEKIYVYPTLIRLFLCLIPCILVILAAIAMLILLTFLTVAKQMPLKFLNIMSVFICLAIIICLYGIINSGPIKTDQSYLYHSFSKTSWNDIVRIKEYNIQSGKKIMVIITKRYNPFFKFIIISNLICDYDDLYREIKNKKEGKEGGQTPTFNKI